MDANKAKRIQSAATSRVVKKIVLKDSGDFAADDVFSAAVKRANSIHGNDSRDKIVRITNDGENDKKEAKSEGKEEVVELEEETFVARKEATKQRKNSVGDLLNKRINLESALQEREKKASSSPHLQHFTKKKLEQADSGDGKENSDKNNSVNEQPKQKEEVKEISVEQVKTKTKKQKDEKNDEKGESNIKEEKKNEEIEEKKKEEIIIELKNEKTEENDNNDENDKEKIEFSVKKEEKICRKNSISEILSRRSSIGIMSPRNTIITKREDSTPRDLLRTKNQENGAQLHYQTTSGNLEAVIEILNTSPELINHRSDDGRTILHISSSLGHLDIVKELLSNRNMEINIAMNNGLTPLMLSAAQGKIDVMQLLLDFGAVYTLQTANDGYSALHLACMHHQLQTIRSLLSYVKEHAVLTTSRKSKRNSAIQPSSGLNDYLELRSNKGYSAFHLATVEGDIDILQLLVEFGADFRAITNKKWSALHFAAHIGNGEICEYLLSLDPSMVNMKNEVKEKPFDIAIFQKRENLLEVLTPKSTKTKRRKRKGTDNTPLENNNNNKDEAIEIKKEVDEDQNDLINRIKNNPSLLNDMKENSKYLLQQITNESLRSELSKQLKETPNMIQEFLQIGIEVLIDVFDNHPHLLLATIQSPISMLKKVKTPAKLFKLLKQIEENPMKDDCKEDPELFFLQQLRDNQFLRFYFVQRLREKKSSLLMLVKAFINVDADDVHEPQEEEKNMKTKMTHRLMKTTVSKYLKKLIDAKDVNSSNEESK